MKTTASAPGKLFILGEHAAVYGYPCIVLAIDKKIHIEAEEIDYQSDIILTQGIKNTSFVEKVISLFGQEYDIKKKVRIKTDSDFSPKLGLGSSSAVTVATIKALSKLYKIPLTRTEIFKLGYKVVLEIQKVGSGADIASSVFGGTILYDKKGKVIKKIQNASLPMVVAYSGFKADTTKLIYSVNKKYKNRRNEIEKIFKNIAKLVWEGKKFIEKGDWKMIGKIMTENHLLLKDLGVSSLKLDSMVSVALEQGAWGAKLSGAGGGDCIIILVSEANREKVAKAIVKKGGQIL